MYKLLRTIVESSVKDPFLSNPLQLDTLMMDRVVKVSMTFDRLTQKSTV